MAGHRHTNSLQAMELAVNHGFCLIELDFMLVDGDLVLDRTMEDAQPPQPLGSMLEWMALNPQVRVVTDAKSDNVETITTLAKKLQTISKDRFIVQIYEPKELPAVTAFGFSDVILTLYKVQMDDDEVIEFSAANDLYAVTMPERRASKSDLAKKLNDNGRLALTHTINDPSTAEALQSMGFSGVYTDYLTPSSPCS